MGLCMRTDSTTTYSEPYKLGFWFSYLRKAWSPVRLWRFGAPCCPWLLSLCRDEDCRIQVSRSHFGRTGRVTSVCHPIKLGHHTPNVWRSRIFLREPKPTHGAGRAFWFAGYKPLWTGSLWFNGALWHQGFGFSGIGPIGLSKCSPTLGHYFSALTVRVMGLSWSGPKGSWSIQVPTHEAFGFRQGFKAELLAEGFGLGSLSA